MSGKGFFASICDFFKGSSSSSVSGQTAANASVNNSSLTGVERYIRNQAATANKPLTGVERYIRNKG